MNKKQIFTSDLTTERCARCGSGFRVKLRLEAIEGLPDNKVVKLYKKYMPKKEWIGLQAVLKKYE